MADLSATIVRCNTSFTFYLSNPQILKIGKDFTFSHSKFILARSPKIIDEVISCNIKDWSLKWVVKNWRFFLYMHIFHFKKVHWPSGKSDIFTLSLVLNTPKTCSLMKLRFYFLYSRYTEITIIIFSGKNRQ